MVTNAKQSSRSLMVFSASWMLLICAFAVTFYDLLETPLWLRIGLALSLIVMALGFYLGGFHFFRAEIKKEMLEIKYYNLFPAGRKFQTVLIPLKQYHHHEIKRQLGGLFKWIIIYQEMAGGVAKYPPIGLSASGKKVQKALNEMLHGLNSKTN